jgi:hypothetical protein
MKKLQPEQTHADIQILAGLIETLPGNVQTTLQGAMVQLNNTLNRKKRILKLVQDALSQLRLDMKYLMFDLEATRRERDELRQELEK